jgi:hypothetical protein
MIRRIRQVARSGDTEQAWALFNRIGLEADVRDADVLSLKGRLIKDRALKASAVNRPALLGDARDAYMRSAAIRRATYPLINAATLALLIGDAGQSRDLALQTIAMLDDGDHEAETPYWLEATRAEAYLLTGRAGEARKTLVNAIAAAPRAWEDHASTLRHFRLVLDTLGEPNAWLDDHRPPPSLHFSGMISIADEGAAARQVGEVLDKLRPSAGYGALAAGADIIIAEALLARGTAVHIVLPAPIATFLAQSVAPFGGQWQKRYETLLESAETVEIVRGPDSVSQASVIIADQLALGMAIHNASQLESSAVALRVSDGRSSSTMNGSAKRKDVQVVDIITERSIVLPQRIAQLERRAVACLAGTWDVEALKRVGGRVEAQQDRQLLVSFSDLVVAARALLALRQPAHMFQLAALDYLAVDPMRHDAAHELAKVLAKGGRENQIVVSHSAAMALLVEAPDIGCEKLGEIASSLGDLPLYLVTGPAM